MSQPINVLLSIMIIISFILAITIHNIGQAFIASRLGDTSAKSSLFATGLFKGAIDPLGLLLCIILSFPLASIPVGLGWGKSVVPDPYQFKRSLLSSKRKVSHDAGIIEVAISGIVILIVIPFILILLTFSLPVSLYSNPLLVRIPQFLVVFAITSLSIAIFELVPLYPLDMYQIVYAILPARAARKFAKSGPYGQYIILAFFFVVPFVADITHLSSIPLIDIIIHLSDQILSIALLLINVFALQVFGSHAPSVAALYVL
jgi:Zn-dependent protease